MASLCTSLLRHTIALMPPDCWSWPNLPALSAGRRYCLSVPLYLAKLALMRCPGRISSTLANRTQRPCTEQQRPSKAPFCLTTAPDGTTCRATAFTSLIMGEPLRAMFRHSPQGATSSAAQHRHGAVVRKMIANLLQLCSGHSSLIRFARMLLPSRVCCIRHNIP